MNCRMCIYSFVRCTWSDPRTLNWLYGEERTRKSVTPNRKQFLIRYFSFAREKYVRI